MTGIASVAMEVENRYWSGLRLICWPDEEGAQRLAVRCRELKFLGVF
jgi:hypothetical protein